MANGILYGFRNLANVFNERVTTVGVGDVMTAIDQSLTEHNKQTIALSSLFASTTEEFKTQFRTATHARLQPLDSEFGRADPIRRAGKYDVSWPIKQAGLARGENRVSAIKMTVGELAMDIKAIMEADARWVRDMILAALFNNAAWNFDDPEHGTLAISPLANGDTVVYDVMSGSDAGATDDHYKAQAAAIADGANPYTTIYDELMEHPENAGSDVIAFIPNGLKATTRALTDFYEESDPNLIYGQDTTRLGALIGVPHPGEVIGYVGGGNTRVWIVEWKSLPAGYILAVATGGEKALRRRVHPETELQGFRMVATRNDYPYSESQWIRYEGYGGWNRVGAVVYQIGSASYAIPTGYTEPVW